MTGSRAALPVVVGVDGSQSALQAVKWAARECALHNVPLRLVHGYFLPTRGYPEIVLTSREVRQAIEEEARGWLERAERTALAISPGLTVQTGLRQDGGTSALIAESSGARLVAVGSQGLGGFTGLLIGSTAVSLVAHGDSPVVVIRGTETPGGPVVVGVDGSPASEEALALAFAFEAASVRDARLTAVMAWTDFFVDSAYQSSRLALDWAEIEEDRKRLLAQRLAGWQEKYPDVRVHRVVVRDRPVRALLNHAGDAQLLVVGSRGHGGFSGMLLGSTSQALIYHAPCPVVVVRGT
jgi:nucleotide-binding universal stress UspA family protein